jgi:hypothetical protein
MHTVKTIACQTKPPEGRTMKLQMLTATAVFSVCLLGMTIEGNDKAMKVMVYPPSELKWQDGTAFHSPRRKVGST